MMQDISYGIYDISCDISYITCYDTIFIMLYDTRYDMSELIHDMISYDILYLI